MKSWVLLILPVLAAANPSPPLPHALARAACNADGCLRAVIASAFTTRSGTADCSSYFRETVTPATSTVTKTLTFTAKPTSTDQVTFTTIISVTTATTLDETSTTSTTSTTIYTDPNLRKRQVTVIPSNIPAYASPCSGSVRYSSACSCVGVVPTVVTAATPLTTTTVSTTVTSTTVTIFTTVLTESDTTVASTSTITTTDATTTVGLVATSTAPATFYLVAVDGPYEGQYLSDYFYNQTPYNNDPYGAYSFLEFMPDTSSAAPFVLDASNILTYVGNGLGDGSVAIYFSPDYVVFLWDATDAISVGYTEFTCSVDATDLLDCNNIQVYTCGSSTLYAFSSGSLSSYCTDTDGSVVTLQAVAV